MTKDEALERIKKAAEENETSLNLTDAGLTEVPPEVWQLTALEYLFLDRNELTILPPEIGGLTNLRCLTLSGNRLTSLPREVGRLNNLRAIGLSYNRLTSLPSEIGQLTNLDTLLLESNQLSTLPVEISQLKHLTELRLAGNPLPIPPEILKRNNPEVILKYYFEQRGGQKKALNEAKVLVVGQGSVGKTSLVKGLMGEKFNPRENKTEGIDIQRWRVTVDGQDVRLNVWDFGGQEIMHATHQFFLTKRSLYVLVLDARVGEEENRVEYWLKIIQSFGKDSPVIVVGNKVDQQRLDIDRRGLQAKYPNIRGFVETSCRTGEGLDELKAAVVREIGALEHIHDPLLVSWFAVKERLEGMKEDYIPYLDYVRLCREEKIDDELSQNTLIGFLHDLGIVLNFRDDPRLEDTNILNPEWVTSGVYKILNSHLLFQNKGALERRELSRILDSRKYPKDKHLFIMDMMRKFELCFDFEGLRDEKFLIPDLLTREEPDTGEWGGSLAFQYHYNVLPSSIISRFIVRMHQYVSMNTLWRTGVVLRKDGSKALVKADIEDKKIFVWVAGPEEARRRFLEVIRSHFDSIHKTIPGIVADEKVPLPAQPEIAADYKHLLRLEERGIEEWIPEGSKDAAPVNVRRLLDGIETERSRRGRYEGRMREEWLDRPPGSSSPPLPTPAAGAPPADAEALAELTRIRNRLDAGSERFAKRCVLAYFLFLSTVVAGLCYLIYQYGWEAMEKWTFLVGALATLGAYGYFAATLREYSLKGIYEHIVELKKIKSYRAAGFDLEKYERLNG